MTQFDYIVLFIIGVAAIGGFLRGFVQEILSLAAWVLALFAIHYMHTDLSVYLSKYVMGARSAALLAFALLLLIPYAGMKLIAGRLGERSRASFLGPIDRVLGFAFGAVKGAVVVVMAFALLVLGYDQIWQSQGSRPIWILNAKVYPYIDKGADMLVQLIDEQQRTLEAQGSQIRGHDK
jgi:membrane protein required for colicin V production